MCARKLSHLASAMSCAVCGVLLTLSILCMLSANSGRPWEMVLVLYGFTTQVQALQFEWAWQHPEKSKAARVVAAGMKKSQRYGAKGKVRLLVGMLHESPWCYYPLTLQFMSQEHAQLMAGEHCTCVACPMCRTSNQVSEQQHHKAH